MTTRPIPPPTSLPAAAVATVLLTFLLGACGREERPRPDSRGVATVGGEMLTEASFRYWWAKAPPALDTPENREALLEKLIARKRMVQRARATGLADDPVVLEAIESILIARLQDAELRPALEAVSVDEDELRARYDAVRDTRFQHRSRSRLAILWFDTRGQEPLALRHRARLQKLRDQLLAGEIALPDGNNFGPLAINHSEHRASRFKGGEIGWIEPDHPALDPWRKAVAGIAAGLAVPGELSEVTACEEGVFLVRLIESAPASARPFEAVRAQLERELLTRKRSGAKARFEQVVSRGAAAVIHHDALSSLTGLGVRPTHPADPRPLRTVSNKPTP